jgi:hypothetical protein
MNARHPAWSRFSRCAASCALISLLAHCSAAIERETHWLEVRVDADRVVRNDTVRVEVEVETEESPGAGWEIVTHRTFRSDGGAIEWPLQFKLMLSRATGPRRYGLVALAHDAQGAVVARAQAIRPLNDALESGLGVHFDSGCFRQSTLCSDGSTCSEGACVSALNDMPLPSDATDTSGPSATMSEAIEGTEEVVAQGSSCSVPGQHACPALGARSTLLCDNGVWRHDADCAENQRCASTGGMGRGVCQPIAPECRNQEPDVPFCDDETMRVCPDLIASKIRPCAKHQHCVPGEGGVQCACTPGFVEVEGACEEATDCSIGAGGCDPLTRCSMLGGQRSCSACPNGYSGTGDMGCAPLLETLSVSAGSLTPAITSDIRLYHVRVPFVSPRVSLIASAPPDTRVSFDEVEVAIGQPWVSPFLPHGQKVVKLVLTSAAGVSNEYELTLERGGAQEAYLKASNASDNDWFGSWITMSGDTAVVGAYEEDGGANRINGDSMAAAKTDSGAAYVFVRGNQGWTQQAYLKASDAQAGDFFGSGVALDGDRLAVGALRTPVEAETANPRSGLVYLFTRTNGTWTEEPQRLTGSNARPGDLFGTQASLVGDTLAIAASSGGAPGDANPRGAVYIFEHTSTGWVERQILTPTERCAGCRFGAAIMLRGDRLIVGAPDDGDDASAGGSAYVFERRNGSWVQQQRLRPEPVAADSRFGFGVAIHDRRAVVGAPYNAPANSTMFFTRASVPAGSAYVFDLVGERWVQTAVVRPPESVASDHFGDSIALSDSALLVGAHGDRSGAPGLNGDARRTDTNAAGAVYLFGQTDEATWKVSDYIKSSNPCTDCSFGWLMALTEDALLVAAPTETSASRGVDSIPAGNASLSGAAYVFR